LAGTGAVGAPIGTAGRSSQLPVGAAGIGTVTGSGGRGVVGGAPLMAAGSGVGTAGVPAVAGSGATTGGGGSGGAAIGGGPVKTAKDPVLPMITGDCPTFTAGMKTMDFGGLKGVIFDVGPKGTGGGSLVFYWHGTGSTSGEYTSSTMQANVMQDLRAKGGIVISPQSGTGTGSDCSGTGTFYQDDFKIADQIAACAVRDWNIDPHRIYSSGCSAGGLMAGCMAMLRPSYLAAAVPNSGGLTFPGSVPLADMSHVPSMMTIHGMMGSDVVIVDFSETSGYIDDAIKKAGGYAMDCDHGGGHCGLPMLPAEAATSGWQFMQDHPFGVSPEPYAAGIPPSFPKYCKSW
jgi:predicted esterase